ncbi:NACHT domain-containing protein, partial [Acidobacteriota bacterium]
MKEKFDAELYTPGEVDKEIFSAIDAKSLRNELRVSIKKLGKTVEEIEKDDHYNFSDFKCFKPGYIDQAKQLLGYRLSLAKEVINTFGKCKGDGIAIIMELSYIILKLADEINEITEELVKSLNDFIRNNHHIDEDSRSKYYRTWGKEVKGIKYLISSSNSIAKALDKIEKFSVKITKTNIPVFGKAGFGKTNLACAICDKMIKQGMPALLILASEIRNPGNVQKQILESLSLDSHMEFNDFLSALNNLGVLRNIKVPVVIDGLNETLPTAAVWSNELSYLIHDIEKFENLVLITTCRESYVEQVFNKKEYKDVANSYYLDGFSDGNIDVVIDRYFSKYGITIKNTDFNRELLKNPLLLKIFCKTNQGQSIRVDQLNIFESLGNYKDELVKKASIKNKREDPICKNALMNSIGRFSAKIWQGNSRGINYPLEFTEIFDPCYDQGRINWEESNSYKVLDEGIFISRRMVGDSEYAEFTYDLLGGYCIAETFLFKNSSPDEIIKNLQSQDILGKIANLHEPHKNHPLAEDIIRSIVYLLPKATGKQFYEIVDNEVIAKYSIDMMNLITLTNQGKESFSRFINQLDVNSSEISFFFDLILSNALDRKHYENVDLLVKTLSRMDSAQIDLYWTETIRKHSSEILVYLNGMLKRFEAQNIENREHLSGKM